MTARLSDLHPAEGSALYLRPICNAMGIAAPAARIAGAWSGFDSAEVILRDRGRTASARAPLAEIRAWAAERGKVAKERIETLLARTTDGRAPFAGLSLDEPRVMGVVNVTPDSFSDGGDYAAAGAAVARGRDLAAEGAAIIDVGGESTRPGSDPVSADEERRRVIPVIEALAEEGAAISIDSRKASVMEAALDAGARIINDTSALTADEGSLSLARAAGADVILMHCRGEPRTMQEAPAYGHAPAEIFDYLEERVAACEAAGLERRRIAVDPGIGFGKTLAHNLAILSHLSLFHGLGCPVLIGASRKSFIGNVSGEERPKARLPGSLAAAIAGLSQGVQLVRVHDVAETVQAIAVWRAAFQG